MGAQSRLRAGQFSWDVIAEQYLDLFASMQPNALMRTR
jgi:hypothetical protein